MNKLILVLLVLFTTTACAGRRIVTVHDYCTNPKHVPHFANYEECYAVKTADKEARLAREARQQDQARYDGAQYGKALSQIGMGIAGARNTHEQTCTTTTNFGVSTTNCN